MLELSTSVQYVKGIGPRFAETLVEKGLSNVEDLLYYLPFRYEDRLNPRGIGELRAGEMASVIAEVRTFGFFRTRRMTPKTACIEARRDGDWSRISAKAHDHR